MVADFTFVFVLCFSFGLYFGVMSITASADLFKVKQTGVPLTEHCFLVQQLASELLRSIFRSRFSKKQLCFVVPAYLRRCAVSRPLVG